jgi:hypothetical protein
MHQLMHEYHAAPARLPVAASSRQHDTRTKDPKREWHGTPGMHQQLGCFRDCEAVALGREKLEPLGIIDDGCLASNVTDLKMADDHW